MHLLRLLALCCICRDAARAATVVSRSPAYYPRLLVLNATASIGVLEKPAGASRRLVAVHRGAGGAWTDGAIVAQDASAAADVANGHVLALPDGTLLAAYRHHTGAGAGRVFRIQVSASLDGGGTWALRSTVDAGPTGLWEPFLFRANATTSRVRVFYAAEVTNGGEQDVVARSSVDGGRTWSPIDARVHTADARNGMPGAVVLPAAAGSSRVLLVFERPVRRAGGPFTNFSVWGVVSTDCCGDAWGAPALVHAPAVAGFNAGSPQVALCPAAGDGAAPRAVAVYMSDEDGAGGAWPDRARVFASYATAAGGDAPLAWTAGGALPAATPSIYWPSLVADGPAARVAYQGSDGAAYVSDDAGGGVCG